MSAPVIFIHGLFGSEKDWRVIAQGLREFRHLSLTLPGHGSKPETLEKYSIDALADWVFGQIKEPSHFVGYSLGGRVVLALYENHPEVFKSLNLISASPGLNEPRVRQARLGQDGQWCDAIRNLTPSKFLSRWYGQELFASLAEKPELLNAIICERQADWSDVFEDVLRETSPGKNKSMWPLIKNISEAVWVVGRKDPKYVAMAQSVIAENPKIEIKCVENAGHAVHLERPQELIDILKEALRKHS